MQSYFRELPEGFAKGMPSRIFSEITTKIATLYFVLGIFILRNFLAHILYFNAKLFQRVA